jgi:ATPase subunit of ABC transporter with duplicated ATPase domains
MLLLQNISYLHSDKELLLEDIHLTVNHEDKIALIGNNGSGKSTLLKMIAGELLPASGHIVAGAKPYYVPQIFGQFNYLTVAQALGIEQKADCLKRNFGWKRDGRSLCVAR